MQSRYNPRNEIDQAAERGKKDKNYKILNFFFSVCVFLRIFAPEFNVEKIK